MLIPLMILFLLALAAIPVGAVCGLIRCIRHRRRPPIVTLVFLGLGGLGLLGLIILSVMKLSGLYLYLYGMGSSQWADSLTFFTVPFLLFGGLFMAMKKLLSWKTLAAGLALSLALFLCGVVYLLGGATYYYTEITSPASVGESHELVFEEASGFMTGTGTVYEKVSPHFMVKLGDYVLDDGYPYVSSGAYRFDWREDGFTLHYGTEAEFEYLQE